MERIDTDALLSTIKISDVVGRFVALKKDGQEQKGICPFHDERTPSLMVNDKKGVYKCFGCGAGGDAINFVMRMGHDFLPAVEIVNGGPLVAGEIEKRAKIVSGTRAKIARWEQIMPEPGNEQTKFTHYKYGAPSGAWTWTDENGNLKGYTVRFNKPDGTKDILPYCWAVCVDEGHDYEKRDGNGGGRYHKVGDKEWRWLGFTVPRSLYNVHLLKQYPTATVLVVEGEKTADAVMRQVTPDRTIAVTWMGGANGLGRADFSPLDGRKVIFWADNDWSHEYGENHSRAGQRKPFHEQPGNKAMLQIVGAIKSPALLKWLRVPEPEMLPCGWDAADKQWEPDELRQFVLGNITDLPDIPAEVPEPEKPKKSKPKGPANPPPPPAPEPPKSENDTDGFFENEHFRFLGYEKEETGKLRYHFFSFAAKAVISLTPSSINKANLMMLAPINWWESEYPGGRSSRVDIDAAQQFLIGMSHNRGTFNETYVRGRGAWHDADKIVIHTGDMLVVDGEKVPLKDFRSRYVYEVGEKLGYGTSKPLVTAEAAKLIDKLKWLMWEREINAYLFAGWCIVSPFCGVLNWRPHAWVTGPSGSGKSWVMDHAAKRLMGDTALVVQGKTSEAGIRGLLQRDARPVLFDEGDTDDRVDKDRIQSIIALARSSSYRDGGVVGKGTQSGGSRAYMMRSCFALSSIGVHLNQQADRNRFTVLALLSFEGKRTKEEFAAFEKEWNGLINEKYVKAMQARTMKLLPVIMKNARTFADAATHVIGQRRIGDQVGSLLAGAYSLTSVNEISYDDAVKWVQQRDWSEEKALEATKDEARLFGKFMGYVTSVETEYSKVDRSIGELAVIVYTQQGRDGVTPQRAHDKLRRLGFMIKDGFLLVANQAEGVQQIIRDTPWASNHNKVIERMRDSKKFDALQFSAGTKSRSVGIPMYYLTDENVQQKIELTADDFTGDQPTDAEPF